MAQHIRQGLTDSHAMLLYKADALRVAVEEFLIGRCGVRRAEVAGGYRRRTEIVEELTFVVETDDLPAVVSKLKRYGARTPLVTSSKDSALFALASGILLRIQSAWPNNWGLSMIACTGSAAHLRKLTCSHGQPEIAAIKRPICDGSRTVPAIRIGVH